MNRSCDFAYYANRETEGTVSPRMKTLIRHFNHQPSVSFTAHLEKELHAFTEMRQIDEARVTLEHLLEASPPFRVALHLVTPGPDFTAEAVDHTLRAALAKAVAELHDKIEDRGANRTRRAHSNFQEPASLQPSAKPRSRR